MIEDFIVDCFLDVVNFYDKFWFKCFEWNLGVLEGVYFFSIFLYFICLIIEWVSIDNCIFIFIGVVFYIKCICRDVYIYFLNWFLCKFVFIFKFSGEFGFDGVKVFLGRLFVELKRCF